MSNKIKANILEAIGQTPIVKLNKVASGVSSEIYVKLEYMNPGGSIKDRIGHYILEQAKKNGEIQPGATIVEGTSGNTGVGLAMWAVVNGHKCIFILADKQSQEKINNLRAFGAKVIVCPTNVDPEDPRSYYSVSKRISSTIPNCYYVNQYDNLLNRECHYHTTGPEIMDQTDGEFDVFCAGVGTGGTISGTGKYLKEKKSDMKIVGIDIEGSILAHYHKTGEMGQAHPYVLEGIGEDIIPANIDWKVIDDFVTVEDKESFLMTRSLLTQEGIYTGGSGGAAVVGALRYAQNLKEPKRILVILPDSGNRYASKIYNDDWMRDHGYLDSHFNVEIKTVLTKLGKGRGSLLQLDEKDTVGDAINLMKEHGVSQIPITSKGKAVGVVTQNDLLLPVYEGKFSLSDCVALAMDRNFVTIDIHEQLEKVTSALTGHKTVLITQGAAIVDILTDIDVLNFINRPFTRG